MKLIVTVTYKDDKKETYECVEFPSTGDFLYLYLTNFKRKFICKDGIARVDSEFKNG